jgi:hypothetical protein
VSAGRLSALQSVRARLPGLPLAPFRKSHSGKGFGRLDDRSVEVERFVPR